MISMGRPPKWSLTRVSMRISRPWIRSVFPVRHDARERSNPSLALGGIVPSGLTAVPRQRPVRLSRVTKPYWRGRRA
jgi:hypothetical protein